MEPRMIGDCQTWSIFRATDDINLIPYQIELRVGGMVYTAQVCPRKWAKGQVFHRSDLPTSSVPYRPLNFSPQPQQQTPLSTPLVNPMWFQGDDVIPMSLMALREIFRHMPPSELPDDFAACLAGDRQAIQANHDAYRTWEKRIKTEGLPNMTR